MHEELPTVRVGRLPEGFAVTGLGLNERCVGHRGSSLSFR